MERNNEEPVVETTAPARTRTTRSRSTTAKSAAVTAEATPATEEAVKAPVKRATRRRVATAAQTTENATEPTAAEVVAETAVETPAEKKPATRKAPVKRATRTRKPATAAAEVPDTAVEAPVVEAPAAVAPEVVAAPEAAKAPVKRATRSRRASAPAQAPSTAATTILVQTPAVESAPAPVAVVEAVVEAVPVVETAAVEEAPVSETPAKRPTRGRGTRSRVAKSTTPEAEAEQAEAPVAETVAAQAPAVEDKAAGEVQAEAAEPEAPAVIANPFAIPESQLSMLFQAPDLTAVPARSAEANDVDEDDEDSADAASGSRRSRRTRSRGRSAETDNGAEAGAQEQLADEDGVVSRRRRRRRRGDQDLELSGGQDDDPPNTVTRVRAPRTAGNSTVEVVPSNRVTGVKGSTRLEAKRQRRRESRESGRRRPVITEAEFLARRESVDRQMIVRQREDRIQIGVLEDGVLAEHFVSKTQQDSLIGNVYVGKVQNVLPSMEAAFVDIGRGRNAVLYAGEVNWDVAGLDGQPRRIEHALKSGDSVLVQVTKDPVGHKGARLTSQISLPGRYLVYVPGGSMTGISRKLPDVERNRLKKILKDHLPENAGVIVRTAAEGASEEELMNDINRLRAQWEGIESASTSTKTLPPELLYGEPDLTIKVVRDVFNEDFSKLIVSGEEAWDTIEAYVTYVAPDLVGRLEKWESAEDIFTVNRIDEQIHKALERKVFLPSGGSLVIDRTEAMTVVDVNTGKFTGSGGNLEETVTKNNLEAAEEVVRQLRLRDIGGIIVIDFIDMVLESNRDLVLRRMVECLGRDRTKHQVAEVTSLGLVQMTRKRMGTGLLEVFGENCEACAGRGVITHDEPVEHRRAYNSHGEQVSTAAPRAAVEKSSRSERRRRNRTQEEVAADAAQAARGQSSVEAHTPAAAPVDGAVLEAKAEATRAAFATIAAAAHAAHELGQDSSTQESASETLTVGGETVALPPRSRRRRRAGSPAQSPELTLEGLVAALPDHSGDVESASAPVLEPVVRTSRRAKRQQHTAAITQGAGAPTVETPVLSGVAGQASKETQAEPARTNASARTNAPVETARKPRRRRAASSPQGPSTGEVFVTESTNSSGGSAHEATLPSVIRAPQARNGAEEPMILGVGVPASEL